MQTVWTYATIGIAVVVLGLGLALRYTLFAERFVPKRMPTSISTSSPSTSVPAIFEETPTPTSTPEALPTPKPMATAPPVRQETTPDGEPIAPSLSETQGRVIQAR